MTERFTDDTLDSITVGRVAGGFHPDREAESRMTQAVWPGNHHEERVGSAQALAMDGVEVRLVGEASLPRQSVRSGGRVRT